MAEYNTVTKTAQNAAALNAKDRVDGITTGGGICVATGSLTTTATDLATGDTINVVDLPAGAQVIPSLSAVIAADTAATALPISVGDAGDADRYMKEHDFVAGGSIPFTGAGTAATIPAAASAEYTVETDNTTVVATLGTVAGNTGTGEVFNFVIAYRASR